MAGSIVLGSRASPLALTQTDLVIAALRACSPGVVFQVRHITTHGDRVVDRSLPAIGGKGVFVKEIEEALLAGDIDLAVHSCKDLPTEQPSGLEIAAILERADPRDALVAAAAATLARLPAGARVGTSSRRRAVQLLVLRPDLQPADIRGNVDTRLRKLDEGRYDAIILAAAGLQRLGLGGRAAEFFDPQRFLPAPGQGALAVEARAGDTRVGGLLAELDHAPTRAAVTAERAFLRGLGGGCDLPIGAYAHQEGADLVLHGMWAGAEGHMNAGQVRGPAAQAEALGARLAETLLERQHGPV